MPALAATAILVTLFVLRGGASPQVPGDASASTHDRFEPVARSAVATSPAGMPPTGAGQLVAFAQAPVVSPVRLDTGSSATGPLDWSLSNDEFEMSWGDGAQLPATLGRTDRFGLVVDSRSQLQGVTAVTSTTVAHASRSATMSSVRTLPPDADHVTALSWLTWQIPDGRYVHVWEQGADRRELLSFADHIVNMPMTVESPVVMHATLPGLTRQTTSYSHRHGGFPGYFDTTLCPVSPPAMITAGNDTAAPGAAPTCLTMTVVYGDESSVGKSIERGMSGPTTTTSTGIGIIINPDGQRACSFFATTAGLRVESPRRLSNSDFAELVSTTELTADPPH